ncbi:MAG: hypothetical protein P4L31_04225 [Candidatus Babeliales bacterium]|nr:hypothetical protein [Candidatus Babeliales bacterium]
MIKKYIISLSMTLFFSLSSNISAVNTDTSCSTLCPQCSQSFLKFCRLCKYKDGILKAKCQNPEKPAKFTTTSCPVIINENTQPAIDDVGGKLQCGSAPQEQQSPTDKQN